MTTPEPTHADVMRWLPRDVQDTLAVTTPCTAAASHGWQHERVELCQFGRIAPEVTEHWWCRHCGAVTTTDPDATPPGA